MNQLFRLTGISILTGALVLVSGCSKDDTTPPDITLNGDNPYQLEMLGTYNEPGFSAQDDEDGNISGQVSVDASNINNKLPGGYQVYYSVTDAAGNTGDAVRDVNVFATTAALAKTYNVVDTCGTGSAAVTFTYQQTVTATSATRITFNKFGDYSNNGAIYADITPGGSLTIPLQSALDIGSQVEDHDFQGTGDVTENGFMLNYTDRNNSVSPVATASCRAYYTRL